MTELGIEELQNMANVLRLDVIEMTNAAGSGHPGGSLSAAELLATLYFRVMRHSPADPEMPERDRFVLSKGHAAPIYMRALAEYRYFPKDELLTLRQIIRVLQRPSGPATRWPVLS